MDLCTASVRSDKVKKERLDKLIASQGLLSRNDVKNMVKRGEVS